LGLALLSKNCPVIDPPLRGRQEDEDQAADAGEARRCNNRNSGQVNRQAGTDR
jgi:hypothetical protein